MDEYYLISLRRYCNLLDIMTNKYYEIKKALSKINFNNSNLTFEDCMNLSMEFISKSFCIIDFDSNNNQLKTDCGLLKLKNYSKSIEKEANEFLKSMKLEHYGMENGELVIIEENIYGNMKKIRNGYEHNLHEIDLSFATGNQNDIVLIFT